MDAVATVAVAEELGRSTYGGFAITVLVHTDMATPHLHHAGTDEQKAPLHARPGRRPRIAAVAMTEADAGSDLASMRTTARRDGERLGAERHQDVHHQRRPRRCLLRRRQDRCAGPQPPDLDVHRREGNAGLLGLAAAEEAWLAEQRHGGAALRRLPAAGGQSAGRGEPGLPRAGEEPAERAAGAGARRRSARRPRRSS